MIHAIYGQGQNWASTEYDFSKEYSWASPEYKNTGFAGLLNSGEAQLYSLEKSYSVDAQFLSLPINSMNP